MDFQYRHTPTTDEYNFIWWSPIFKGGLGSIVSDNTVVTKFAGVFVRPLLPLSKKGDLIVGLQGLHSKIEKAWEFQGEYRFTFGLGIGGGLVRRTNKTLNTNFGKVSYRNKYSKWNYILEGQAQRVGSKTSPGGYAAIYRDQIMLTLGSDSEQWRASIGYIAPKTNSRFRPVLEVLHVDNNIGRLRGPKSFFVNGSLKYYGGFLSHPARLGRAMGPTGLEFGNPLGFLSSTWNRRLDVWELGDMFDYRLERVTQPNGQITGRYEFLAFPFQFDKKSSAWDRLFGGGLYTDRLHKHSLGMQGGYFGKLSGVDLTLKAEYSFAQHEKGLSLGVIRRF